MSVEMKKELKYAFIKSIPVMCGYLFLGIAFGILLQNAGFNYVWALGISMFVYAGSMQFVMVPMLVAAVSPVTMAVTTLFVNCRHIFYGLSFIEEFQKSKVRWYMIFSLTDETYSILCQCKTEETKNGYRATWFFISCLDHLYWIIGSVIGAVIGNVLPIDFTGIEFAMTVLFVVILIEQVIGKEKQTKVAAGIGVCVGVGCLFLFGVDQFLLPALLVTVFLLFMIQVHNKKHNEENMK